MVVEWKDSVADDLAKQTLDGLEELGRLIETDARENCPVDKGTLRNSHVTERDDETKTITIGCGGPAAPYALKQHEDASLHHTVGESHWLENAFARGVQRIPEFVGKA